jgi:diacylglycerol O-acyltransferase / wax synthase
MPALSVIDLAMFLLETDERPFNIGPLAVLAPPSKGGKAFADKLVARMKRSEVGPPFNYRLHKPAVGLPSLVIDDDADPATQLHRLTLDRPGSTTQLRELVCRLHEQRLDHSGLLWELYVIDGLEGGRVAVYGKVHHGIIDGRTFVEVVSSWFSKTAEARAVRAMWEGVPRRQRAGGRSGAAADTVSRILQIARGAATTGMALSRMLARQALSSAGYGDGLALPIIDVPDVFRGRVEARRSFAYCMLPLAAMKAYGKVHAATVNDVLLTVLDMAMARLLQELKVPATAPLIADMPIALADAHGGNQIAVLQFPLGRPQQSPRERLATIKRETGRVKEALRREAPGTAMLYTTLVHALPAVLERIGLKRSLNVANLMVSNPFGLAEERYLMGARAELLLPISVVPAGQLLNVTAVTLGDRVQIAFLAMPKAVPHVDKLADYTVAAFAELTREPAQRARGKRRTRAVAAPASAVSPRRRSGPSRGARAKS